MFEEIDCLLKCKKQFVKKKTLQAISENVTDYANVIVTSRSLACDTIFFH
jgi:hypothetical protein